MKTSKTPPGGPRARQRSLRILLTAGPTHEPIDAVRYLGNRSSGRMGAAIATAALAAGHRVTVVRGPVCVEFPRRAAVITIETAAEMRLAMRGAWPTHDVLIMAAAVADFTPVKTARGKIDRTAGLVLKLKPTPDLVAEAAAARKPGQIVVGFALEAQGGVERAGQKLRRKGLDLIVYNPPSTMGSDAVEATLIDAADGVIPLKPMSKPAFARNLLRRIEAIHARA